MAPLYDIASALAYEHLDRKRELAMKIGGEYLLLAVGLRQWRKLAQVLRIDEDQLIQRIGEIVRAMPNGTAKIRERVEAAGIRHDVIGRLAIALTDRATRISQELVN